MFYSPLQFLVKTVDCVIKAACVLHCFIGTHDCSPANVGQAQQNDHVSANYLATCQHQTDWRIREAFTNYFICVEGAVPCQYSALQFAD